MSGRQRVATIRELAVLLDMKERQLYRWSKEPGWPAASKDGYDVEACRRYAEARSMAGRKKPARPRETVEESDGATSATETLRRVRAAKAAVELQKLKGTLVSRDQVEAMLVARQKAHRDALLLLSHRVSGWFEAEAQKEVDEQDLPFEQRAMALRVVQSVASRCRRVMEDEARELLMAFATASGVST